MRDDVGKVFSLCFVCCEVGLWEIEQCLDCGSDGRMFVF